MNDIDESSRKELLSLARQSIRHALQHGDRMVVATQDYEQSLCEFAAVFVTLKLNGELRGCIGNLQATHPLAEAVAVHAFDAAFGDPRFAPLTQNELAQLVISVSVLTRPKPLEFDSESELLEKITPGKDGLILQYRNHRGTFLPSVWKELPKKKDFLDHLKRKAGLPTDFWSDEITVERYQTVEFSEAK